GNTRALRALAFRSKTTQRMLRFLVSRLVKKNINKPAFENVGYGFDNRRSRNHKEKKISEQ
ncbi:18317_t:CDS:1, partial [Gigaspora rosea]